MYSSKAISLMSHDWDSIELFVGLATFVAFGRQMHVTSQDYHSINYLWD